MSGSLKDCCDQYIERCKKVLSSKDTTAARVLRTEATLKFHALIPRWNAGLMASITHYYLDDIESILCKLTAFRQQLDAEGDRDYNETVSIAVQQHMNRQLYRSKVDSFEYTCTWIRDCYAASASEKDDILARIWDLQQIAVSTDSLEEKWNKLRSFFSWMRSLNAELAAHMLPLFAEVLE